MSRHHASALTNGVSGQAQKKISTVAEAVDLWFEGWFDGSINGTVHPNSLLPRVVTEDELRDRVIAQYEADQAAEALLDDLPPPSLSTMPTSAAAAAPSSDAEPAAAPSGDTEPAATPSGDAEPAAAPSGDAEPAIAMQPAPPGQAAPDRPARYFVVARGKVPGFYLNWLVLPASRYYRILIVIDSTAYLAGLGDVADAVGCSFKDMDRADAYWDKHGEP